MSTLVIQPSDEHPASSLGPPVSCSNPNSLPSLASPYNTHPENTSIPVLHTSSQERYSVSAILDDYHNSTSPSTSTTRMTDLAQLGSPPFSSTSPLRSETFSNLSIQASNGAQISTASPSDHEHDVDGPSDHYGNPLGAPILRSSNNSDQGEEPLTDGSSVHKNGHRPSVDLLDRPRKDLSQGTSMTSSPSVRGQDEGQHSSSSSSSIRLSFVFALLGCTFRRVPTDLLLLNVNFRGRLFPRSIDVRPTRSDWRTR